jgi:hypothetical protein
LLCEDGVAVGTILLLALASAVYPQLLAVVVIILTRPNPQPLLLACYIAGIAVSVGSSLLILAVFRSRGSIAGTTSNRLGPGTYLVVGTIALLLAVLMVTGRGRALAKRAASARPRPRSRERDQPTAQAKLRGRAEGALREGSLMVAALIGVLLAIPGPFDFLALGRLARGGYGAPVAAVVMVGFALVKFVLIEIPIAGYAIDPDGTAGRVSRFSSWMQANKLAAGAAIVAVVGIVLVGRGISALG